MAPPDLRKLSKVSIPPNDGIGVPNESTSTTHGVTTSGSGVSPPLRVGILLDSLEQPRWVLKILNDIRSSDFAQISLVILNADSQSDNSRPWPRFAARAKDFWRRGLFNRYVAWDYRRYRGDDDPFGTISVQEVLANARLLKVKPVTGKFTDRFKKVDLEQICNAGLDVLLRFGFRILKGRILTAARYGVWSYHHGDNREYRGGPALFWEMYERNPVSGSVLQVLSKELDGGRVIFRSLTQTNFDSLYTNRKAIYWKSAQFMVRRLRDLHRYGWDYITTLDEFHETIPYRKGIYRTPTNLQMVRFLTRRFVRGLHNQIRRVLFGDRDHNWFIAYRRIGGGAHDWRLLLPPAGHFYADPFLLKRGGHTYLFFEDFIHGVNKGVISMVEIHTNGNPTEVRVVLECDTHLSYPFVFEHQGEVYLMPETMERNRVELYRATDFPLDWTLDRVLLDGVSFADSTLHEQDGKWWLFANIATPSTSTWDELHVYFAPHLTGPWIPHPRNPVVSDVRSARPAGRLFVRDGKLIRPAQDCSVTYGYAVTLNRVDTLNETEYHERPIEKILPNWIRGNLGTHTVNQTDELEIRDGKFRNRKLRFLKAYSCRTKND